MMSDTYLTPLGGTRGFTRRHAMKVFAACAGGAVLGSRLPLALGDLPWAEQPAAVPLDSNTTPLSIGTPAAYGKQRRQAHPTLTLEPSSQRLWTSWSQLRGERETILLRSFATHEESWSEPLEVPDSTALTIAGESQIAAIGGRVLVVWSEYGPDGWGLAARSLDPATGEFTPVSRLAGASGGREIHIHPALAVLGDRAAVVWQGKRAGRENFSIFGRMLDAVGRPVGEVLDITVDSRRDCCRPAIAAHPRDRRFAVAFDRQDLPGTQNVYVVMLDADAGAPTHPLAASNHPASDVAPAVAYSPKGDYLWVAWHSNRKSEAGWDIPRWYRLAGLRCADSTWHQPAGGVSGPPQIERATVQGFELVRLVVSPAGVVCVLGRASHNFYVQYYSSEGRSPVYRLPRDGWGGRGKLMPGVFDSDGALWVTRRDLGTNVLDRIDGLANLSGPATLPNIEPTMNTTPKLAGVAKRIEWPRPADMPDNLNVYFGDIHGHSWQSDGMGEPAESFLRARDLLGDDFHALTDHDNFVGQRFTDVHWQQQKDLVEHYDAPGAFVTLFAQEWTSPRVTHKHGWGHFNVYTADPDTPLLDHRDACCRDLSDLYAAVRAHNGIAIPHHIGWTGVPWEALDVGLTPIVEICSVHGVYEYEGNEPISHRGGLRGNFYRDGLARGLRVGVAGGSDQHGLIWHHGVCWKRNVYRAGLTGVWASELTRAAILDACRNRRTFATTGVKMQLYFAVDDELMGGAVESGEAPRIRVDVSIPPDQGRLRWIQIIRDGQVINSYGGEAQRSRYTFIDHDCPPTGAHSYYLRVTLADDNMAWSSPVWVARG